MRRLAAGARLGVAGAAALVALSCAARVEQFYRDVYYPEDRIYQNEALGFALMFPAGWRIETDPSRMSRPRRAAAAQLRRQGAELVFAGETVEGLQGTRGIVENLNRTNEEFLAALRSVNAAGLEKDIGATTFMAGDVLSVKWEYVFQGLCFVEFLFRAGTHNVRIAFWTKPELYDSFLPVYENAMASLSLSAVP